MSTYAVIDSDSHVVEPPDLWLNYIEPRFMDRAPHVLHDEDTDRWVLEGVRLANMRTLIGVGRPFDDPRAGGRYETDVLPGGYDPDARLKEMAGDGVDAQVVYATVGLRMFMLPDTEFRGALFRAYNTWVAGYANKHPDRLKAIGLIGIEDVEEAVAELERCKRLGHSGALIMLEGAQCHLPQYHPFWAVAERLEIPISLHTATGAIPAEHSQVEMVVWPVHSQRAFAAMVFSGLFDKFPSLKVVSAENDAGWAASFIERMDFFYHLPGSTSPERSILCQRAPSEIVHRSISFSFQRDLTSVAARHIIGVNNLMWSSDYPHLGSTWPDSREVIAEHFRDVPEADKRKVVCENAARLYGFESS